jgi:pyridoxine 4-dehydrogenase
MQRYQLGRFCVVGVRRDESGAWLPYDEPDQLRWAIEDNLRTLGVEQLAAVNLRLVDDATPDLRRFDDQLTAMIQTRDDGLIGGVGLSNITDELLLRALERTPVACVQNPLKPCRSGLSSPSRGVRLAGIAFVPFFPLGSGFVRPNPVLDNKRVRRIAERLGITPAQVALAWTLSLAPNILLIPGTSSVRHLEENLAVADIELDDEAQQQWVAVAK